jgi:hypothetical protein
MTISCMAAYGQTTPPPKAKSVAPVTVFSAFKPAYVNYTTDLSKQVGDHGTQHYTACCHNRTLRRILYPAERLAMHQLHVA